MPCILQKRQHVNFLVTLEGFNWSRTDSVGVLRQDPLGWSLTSSPLPSPYGIAQKPISAPDLCLMSASVTDKGFFSTDFISKSCLPKTKGKEYRREKERRNTLILSFIECDYCQASLNCVIFSELTKRFSEQSLCWQMLTIFGFLMFCLNTYTHVTLQQRGITLLLAYWTCTKLVFLFCLPLHSLPGSFAIERLKLPEHLSQAV